MTDEVEKPVESEFIKAVKDIDLARVKELLDLGADANKRDTSDTSCLNIAVAKKSLGLAELLLDKGADIDEGGNNIRTPLIQAMFPLNLEMMRYLLERGADVEKKGGSLNVTPLSWSGIIAYYTGTNMSEASKLLVNAPELRRQYLERKAARATEEARQKKLDDSHTAAATTQDNIRSKRSGRSTVKPRPAP